MTIQIQRQQSGGGGPVTYPTLVLGWEQSRAGSATVQNIIGGGVAITIGASLPRAGTLRLFYADETAAVECFNMHEAAAFFTLFDDTNPDEWKAMSYVVTPAGTSIRLDDTTRRRWTVEVNYQELQPWPEPEPEA